MKNNQVLLLMIFVISLLFESCTGCSNSGRQRMGESNQYSSGNTKSKRSRSKKTNHNAAPPTQETSIKVPSSTKKTVSQLFRELEKGVFIVYAMDEDENGAQGSGFFINKSGIGITNAHVLEGYDHFYIKTSQGEKYKITNILKYSSSNEYDYVIFKVNGKGFESVNIANNKAPIGADIFAIGSPLGLENSLTRGSVSGYRDNYLIQIDATINHGSSGGPLFNMDGEVIGINTSIIEGTGLNFAVNIQVVPYDAYVD